jgi:hypothetical protein
MGVLGRAPSRVVDTGGGRWGAGDGEGETGRVHLRGDDGSDRAGAAVLSGEGEVEEREGTGRRGREKIDELGATGAMTGTRAAAAAVTARARGMRGEAAGPQGAEPAHDEREGGRDRGRRKGRPRLGCARGTGPREKGGFFIFFLAPNS